MLRIVVSARRSRNRIFCCAERVLAMRNPNQMPNMTPAGTAGPRNNTNASRARTPHTPHRHPTTAASRFLSSPDQMKCDSAQLPMVESVYLEILSKPPSWRPPACWVCRGECASNGQADPATRQYQQYCGACRDGLRARRAGHEKPPSHFRHSIAFFWSLAASPLRSRRTRFGAPAAFGAHMRARADFDHPTRMFARPRAAIFLGGPGWPARTACIKKKIVDVDFFVSAGADDPARASDRQAQDDGPALGTRPGVCAKNDTRSRCDTGGRVPRVSRRDTSPASHTAARLYCSLTASVR